MKDFIKLSGRRPEEGPAPLVESKEETGNGFKTN
jgi:hypothetical protein